MPDDSDMRRVFFGCLICCACLFGVIGVILGIVALVEVGNVRSDLSTTTTTIPTTTIVTAGLGGATPPPLKFADKAHLAASLRAALARNTNANAAAHVQAKRSVAEDGEQQPVELAHNTLSTQHNVDLLQAIPAVGKKRITTLQERMLNKGKKNK